MILTTLILLPLVGAVVTAALPTSELARRVGLVFALVTLGAAITAAVQYEADAGMQLTETHTWIESLGVHYALGVDGLGILMVLLTVVLVPIVLLAGWQAWLSPTAAVGVALASIVVRFVLLGSVVSYLDGERSTWKNVLIGIGLAVAGLVVAGVKLALTH